MKKKLYQTLFHKENGTYIFRTYILDTMVDALDPLNISNSDKDVENSNKFDFIIEVDEIKFKNKKEMEEYIEKNDKKNNFYKYSNDDYISY